MKANEGFRVVLILQMFQDRKKHLYYVDPNTHHTIHDVVTRIKERYLIERQVDLHINGCWLHENENVLVLREGDIISVVEADNSTLVNEKETKSKGERHQVAPYAENLKSIGKESDNDFAISDELLNPEKRFGGSFDNETLKTSDSKYEKRKRKRKHEDIILKLEENSEMNNVKNEYSDVTNSKDQEIVQSFSSTNGVDKSNENSDNENNILVKKKRTRRHKKKNGKRLSAISNDDFSCTTKIPVVENKIFNKSHKHVKFVYDENGECLNPAIQNGAVNTHHDNPGISDEAKKIDIPISSKSAVEDLNLEIQSTSITEGSIAKYGTHITSIETLKDRNSSLLIFECKRPKQSPDSNSNRHSEKEIDYLNYPLLKSSPKVKDLIGFKIWKMDDDYCPGISKYISAQVLKAPEGDGLIRLKILSGQSELKEPQGKFSITTESEDQEVKNIETIEIIDLNFRDLLETRLIYP